MKHGEAAAAAAKKTGVRIAKDICAAELTTFRGGGCVAAVFMPDCAERAAEFVAGCVAEGEELFVLGGGSDTVAADGRILRPVMLTREMRDITVRRTEKGVLVRAECGAKLSAVAAAAGREGGGGLEFMAGVPASLGGALSMNAGAFGAEIADNVIEIERLSACCGRIEKVAKETIPFAYRRGADGILLAATLLFPYVDAAESAEKTRRFVAARRARQPSLPSCGSVFKRGALPAGAFIEEAGLKGVRLGGAEFSEVHANFIVNTGGATFADFMGLVRLAETRVEELFGERLEREFKILADDLPF